MVFSSYIFLFVFLPLALGIYYVLPVQWRNTALTLLSYLFYGWANPLFVLLMLASTMVDYVCGLVMSRGWRGEIGALPETGPRSGRQRLALWVSLLSNLSLLGFFKYYNFGVDSLNGMAGWLGGDPLIDSALRVTLPLGISFYTFQSMSYSIDVYRGKARAIRWFPDFACYVSMFPQLVAGPIVRFEEIASQLVQRVTTPTLFARRLAFLSLGLAKKVLVANSCGKVADIVFQAAGVTTLEAWVGAVAYAFQIYFDFSGYSDMAIGLGLMFGFVFPLNFDSPYRADSITDFWRRWHLSLSRWLRDYLYIPLGGNRGSTGRTCFNLMAVMVLGGLWHGASWTFVIWGAVHGLLLVLERLMGKDSVYRRLPRCFRVLITFVILCFTWVVFRSENPAEAGRFCLTMLGFESGNPVSGLVSGLVLTPWSLGWLFLAALLSWFGISSWQFTERLTLCKALWVVLLFAASICTLSTQSFNPFIYFIF
ncbi:MAG: MBOAT family O-acyltransferase [Verrucomicrobiota bacterium]